jgi:hypothetical protein
MICSQEEVEVLDLRHYFGSQAWLISNPSQIKSDKMVLWISPLGHSLVMIVSQTPGDDHAQPASFK